MKCNNFAEDVQGMKDAIVASTIEVYTKISKELRATPAKFHYSFNLRDVSKVVQGILMTRNVSINNLHQINIHPNTLLCSSSNFIP